MPRGVPPHSTTQRALIFLRGTLQATPSVCCGHRITFGTGAGHGLTLIPNRPSASAWRGGNVYVVRVPTPAGRRGVRGRARVWLAVERGLTRLRGVVLGKLG